MIHFKSLILISAMPLALVACGGSSSNSNNNSEGSLSITGQARQNATLQATLTDEDGFDPAGVSYVWLADGSEIAGATASSFVLTAEQVGAEVTVSATYTDDSGNEENVASAPLDSLVTGNEQGQVSIDGGLTVGSQLSASIVDADGVDNATVSYQWLVNGVAATGETSATYTILASDAGATVQVEVTYTDNDGVESALTASSDTAVNYPGSVEILGTLDIGSTLTTEITDLDSISSTVDPVYQWLAGDVAIDGATNSTFTLTSAQSGAVISVSVTYTDALGIEDTVTAQTAGEVDTLGQLAIFGLVQLGAELAATLTDADGVSGAVTYQWAASGVAISGATNMTYTLTSGELGDTITVTSTYTDDLGFSASVTSAPTIEVEALPPTDSLGSIAISGSSLIFSTLTANISDPDGVASATYQWLDDGVAIAGATGRMFTLTPAQASSQITVTATYTDNLTFNAVVTSNAFTSAAANNIGSVTISGGDTVGSQLTANVVDADGFSSVVYQWFDDGTAIGGATGQTFTLTNAEASSEITVTASYTDTAGYSESIASSPFTTAAADTAGSVSISGDLLVDSTLSATLTDSDGFATAVYQWFDDGVAIAAATSSTFTLTSSQADSQITVTADYTDNLGYQTVVTSSAVTSAGADNAGAVAISGNTTVGSQLTATITDADGVSSPASYQWFDDGVEIAGATNQTFTITTAQANSAITVEATYTDDVGYAAVILSPAFDTAAPDGNGSVAIAGNPLVGSQLTATVTDADGFTVVSYQWFDDGVAIGGATAQTFTLTAAQASSDITVTATYTDNALTDEVVSSVGFTSVAANSVGSVAISGDLIIGSTLTATITDTDGIASATYEWFDDGVAIAGATNQTFTLTAAQASSAITVVADYTDNLGYVDTVTSAAVNSTAQDTAGSVAISGGMLVGSELTATITDDDGVATASYQWFDDGVAIAGAINSTFTVTSSQASSAITVTTDYTDNLGYDASITSNAVNISAADNLGSVAISGSTLIGSTLTATITDADGFGSVAYQWQANSVAISGATLSTYQLTSDEAGDSITVSAIYTDNAGYATDVTSASLTASAADTQGTLTITGDAYVGETLTANLADADGVASSPAATYQWRDDGVAISGATSSTYTLTLAEAGGVITVVSTYTDSIGYEDTLTSSGTSAVNSSGSISISGTAQEGQTLTGDITDVDGFSGSATYVWQADGTTITGATSATYVLTSAEVGEVITVQATYTDDGGRSETVTSAATAAVTSAPVNQVGAVTLQLTNEWVVGDMVSAVVTDGNGTTGSTFTYQWAADGVDISGATSSSFTMTTDERGAEISVTVSYTDDEGFAETPSATAEDVVYTFIVDGETALVAALASLADGDWVGLDSADSDDYTDMAAIRLESQSDVTIRRTTGSTAVIAGETCIELNDPRITLDNLVFENIYAISGSRCGDSSVYLNDTDTVLTNSEFRGELSPVGRANADDFDWVLVRGTGSIIERNVFSGNQSGGATNKTQFDGAVISVDNDATASSDEDHTIRYNVFKDFGTAGSDSSRSLTAHMVELGRSSGASAAEDGLNTVAYNLFRNVYIDRRLIYVQSSNNIIEGNSIFNSSGMIAMESGESSIARNNIMINDDSVAVNNDDGGIAFGPYGHTIDNNYIAGMRTNSSDRAGLFASSEFNGSGNTSLTASLVTVSNNTVVNGRDLVEFSADSCIANEFIFDFDANLVASGEDDGVTDNVVGGVVHTGTIFALVDGCAPSTTSDFDNNHFYSDDIFENDTFSFSSFVGASGNIAADSSEGDADLVINVAKQLFEGQNIDANIGADVADLNRLDETLVGPATTWTPTP